MRGVTLGSGFHGYTARAGTLSQYSTTTSGRSCTRVGRGYGGTGLTTGAGAGGCGSHGSSGPGRSFIALGAPSRVSLFMSATIGCVVTAHGSGNFGPTQPERAKPAMTAE